jgi:hypothetical protein
MIMLGPFGDPLYQGSGWEKRAYTEYGRQSLKPMPGETQRFVQRFVAQQHYMWNTITRSHDQVKFSTSSSQGCVGDKTVAGAWIEGEAFLGASILAAPFAFEVGHTGFFNWGRTFHIFDRSQSRGSVTVVGNIHALGSGFGTVMASTPRGGCSSLCIDTDL